MSFNSQSKFWVGNSQDNRDIQFSFNVFKTELIYRLDTIKMQFLELSKHLQITLITIIMFEFKKNEFDDSY